MNHKTATESDLVRILCVERDFSTFIPQEIATAHPKLTAIIIWSCEFYRNKRATASQLQQVFAQDVSVISTELSFFAPPSAANVSLLSAVRSRSVEGVDAAFKAGADANYKPRGEGACFIDALTLPNIEILKLFLANGVNSANKQSALRTVVMLRKNSFLQVLLENKTDPSYVDKYGDSAMHVAIRNGDDVAFALLLKHGANPNSNPENTALDCAILSGKIQYIPQLLALGGTYNQSTLLHDSFTFLPADIQDEIRNMLPKACSPDLRDRHKSS